MPTAEYVVQKGTTCVPDCWTPWTGGPFPTPTQSRSDDPGLEQLGKAVIIGGTIGGIVGLLVLGCCIWLCVKGCSPTPRQRPQPIILVPLENPESRPQEQPESKPPPNH